LQAAEFLINTRLFPDPHYTFKHALTQEVAYGGLLRERRREIHANIVDAMEKLYGDRASEQVDRLAHHAFQGELHEKAVLYLCQAGAKAAARSALTDARTWFERALDALKALPESRANLERAFDIRIQLRRVLRQLGEGRRMLDHLRAAAAVAERLGDDRRLGRVYALMTTVHSSLDELHEALKTGTRALDIAERLGDLRLRIVAMSHLEQAHYYRSEFQRVLTLATDNLAAIPPELVQENFGMASLPSVFGRAWLIMSLTELGDFAGAARHEAEAIKIAATTQHAHTIGWAHLPASMLHLFTRDWVGARSLIEQWLNQPGTLDVAVLLPWAVASASWALAEIGNGSEALKYVREGERLLQQQAVAEIIGHRGWAYSAMGRACRLLGLFEEAQRLGVCAIEFSRHQPGFTAHALRLLGDIASHPDWSDAETGEIHYRESLRLAGLRGMRPLAANCHLALGRLYRRTAKPVLAREHISIARTMFREMAPGTRSRTGVTPEADLDGVENHAS
jgi:tetratricopeptide (TPR) repeat protein